MTVLFIDPNSGHAHADWQDAPSFLNVLASAQVHAHGFQPATPQPMSGRQQRAWRVDSMTHALNQFFQSAEGSRLDMERVAQGLVEQRIYRADGESIRLDSGLRDADGDLRMDAFGDNPGAAFARQLEFVHSEILREEHPVPTALQMFPTGSGIPLGARTHTVRRINQTGEADWYRGDGTPVGRVSYARDEVSFPVRTLVTSFDTDVFQMQSMAYANVNDVAERLRSARDLLELKLGEYLWSGDNRVDFYGINNFPYLPRRVAATAFDGTATPADVIAELNNAASYAYEASKQVFFADSIAMSPRVHRYLSTTQFSTASDTTILEYFIRTNPRIQSARVMEAHELENLGGVVGTDGIFFFRAGKEFVANETAGGIQVLPPQFSGFRQQTFLYLQTGGVVMRKLGNQLMLEVVASS